MEIKKQSKKYRIIYLAFGLVSFLLLMYYLSYTLNYFTTSYQFPVNSFERFPLTWLIFPAELFSLLFAIYFAYTLYTDKNRNKNPFPLENKNKTNVALLLPVYNEPEYIVKRTVIACKKIRWKGQVNIYLLDDSTDEENKKAMTNIANDYGLKIIRRKDRVGYKAGNINNAISKINEPYFVIFDSDQAPNANFLEKTMDYFSNKNTGFVQTPQYYINENSPLERAQKIGANIFFQSQTVSKANDNAMPFCGTNVIVRKDLFMKVKGFRYYTATEDIDLGIRINDLGYYGVYHPEVLVKGYAAKDFKSFSSQQYRWSNGNLAILRENFFRLLLGKNFSIKYQIHTFFTLGWWFIGVSTFIFIIIPLISLYSGLGTHHTWLPFEIIILLFFNVIFGISMIYFSLQKRTNDKVTLKDAFLEYSLITNSMFIYIKAFFNVLFKKYVGFVRTNKEYSKTSLKLVKWNIILSAITFISSLYALYMGLVSTDYLGVRTFIPISIWLLFYSLILMSSILFVKSEVIFSET